MTGEPDGSEDIVRGMFGPDVTFLGVPRAELGSLSGLDVVFLSFDLTPDVSVKQIGLGLAAAVLVDATLVRLVLVPAVMELLGKANWWLPGWLDRLLPGGRAKALGAAEPPASTLAEVR